MGNRCIVNVATGEFYCKLQQRLNDSFSKTGVPRLLWTDRLPMGSRQHLESPYGFKIYAIKAAFEEGYTSILWLDSPCIAVKEDISPIFDKIENHGYYVMSHIDPLENWIGTNASQMLSRKEAEDLKLNLPSGSCYGFDLLHANGIQISNQLIKYEAGGYFKSEAIKEGSWHRHDETMLAIILHELGLPIFTFDPLFQSDSEECVIKSGGWI